MLSKKEKHSRRYQRLLARKSRFLAKQKRKRTDIEHKVSRSVVNYAVERRVGTLVIGDVRDAADGVNHGKKSNQKISNWSHMKVRSYIEYKAAAAGIQTELVNEAYTSQTCPNPNCLHKIKPKGRVYRCPACPRTAVIGLVVSWVTGILSEPRTFSPGIYTGSWGRSTLRTQSIVTRLRRASVVRWTPGNWLGKALIELGQAEKPPYFNVRGVSPESMRAPLYLKG